MDLSFIIVSWNAKRYLLECLESLIKELEGFQAEIIVVDNGSTDGSKDLIKERFSEVVLIENNENFGFAKANNIGILRSKGKYIFLLNSDVKILDGCIESMISYMETHPEVGLLGPQILNPDHTIQPSCKLFPTLLRSLCRTLAFDSLFPKVRILRGEFLTFLDGDTTYPVDIIVGCFWMVRRTAVDEVGLLDERFFIYSEDKDWCKRCNETGWGVVYFPKAKIIHYGGASSNNAPIRFYIEMQKANMQYWEKHHGRISSAIFRYMLYINNICRLIGYLMVKLFYEDSSENISEKIERSKVFLHWMRNGATKL